jgi:hypothetical protein
MTIRVYRTAGYLTRSIIRASLVVEVDVESCPNHPEDFADRYDGDFVEVVPGEEDHEQIWHDR